MTFALYPRERARFQHPPAPPAFPAESACSEPVDLNTLYKKNQKSCENIIDNIFQITFAIIVTGDALSAEILLGAGWPRNRRRLPTANAKSSVIWPRTAPTMPW